MNGGPSRTDSGVSERYSEADMSKRCAFRTGFRVVVCIVKEKACQPLHTQTDQRTRTNLLLHKILSSPSYPIADAANMEVVSLGRRGLSGESFDVGVRQLGSGLKDHLVARVAESTARIWSRC